jgi:hypothetical protein
LEIFSFVVGHQLHSVGPPRCCYEEIPLPGSLLRFVGPRTGHRVAMIPGIAPGLFGMWHTFSLEQRPTGPHEHRHNIDDSPHLVVNAGDPFR